MNYNRVILGARLTRDPQGKYLPNQTFVCEFGVAASNRFKGKDGEMKEDVCFVDCTAFGKQGELINQSLHKGSPILIEGRLKYENWEDKNGGGKRSKLSVVVEEFRFVGPREDGGGQRVDRDSDQTRGGGSRPVQRERPQKFDEASIPF